MGQKDRKKHRDYHTRQGLCPQQELSPVQSEESQDEITVLEYGQYALIGEIAKDVYSALKQYFPADRIEYTYQRISDTDYVYVFHDIDENEKCRFNYQHCIELGKSGYTQEKFEQNKKTFGVYVLQSNAALSAEEVFGGYKKRWDIETFYQYLKNKGDFNDFMLQDYYKEQGMSFIMLITGQIHQKMISRRSNR